jgi:hypothetical protein
MFPSWSAQKSWTTRHEANASGRYGLRQASGSMASSSAVVPDALFGLRFKSSAENYFMVEIDASSGESVGDLVLG